MLAVNFLVASGSIWLIIFINSRYLQPALKNRQRFRLYKLRDELSLIAMRGELDERSDEYITLIELINPAIRATGSFKVTDFLKFALSLHRNKEVQRKILQIIESLSKTDNPNYCKVARDYFAIMSEILYSDTRVLRHVFVPVMRMIAVALEALKLSSEPKKHIENKKKVICEMKEEFNKHSEGFGRMCAA